MTKIRVLLVEDHLIVREGLKMLLNTEPDLEVVGEASNGREALEMVKRLLPDVVVMDITMPEMGGAEATQRIIKKHPEVKVLALTAHEDSDYLRQLLKAGASGYLLKRAAADELPQALHAVAAGGVYVDPKLASKIVRNYVGIPTSMKPSAEIELTDREEEVLRQLAWGHSNREIAEQFKISVKTVETHRGRLMGKLGLHSRADLVRFAIARGWMQET